MKRFWFLPPILIAVNAVMTLVAANIAEMAFGESLRSFLLAIVFALFLVILMKLILRDAIKASILATFSMLLFFSYGHVYAIANDWQILGFDLGRHLFLAPIYFVLWLGCIGFVRMDQRDLETAYRLIVFSSIALILFPSLRLANYAVTSGARRIQQIARLQVDGESEKYQASGEVKPDVYYIILDGYGREDVLNDLYGYDNRSFLDDLRQMGFFIANRSTSNYNQTMLSLTSSLNMDYLQEILPGVEEGATDRGLLVVPLQNNNVFRRFREEGYLITLFETGYAQTELPTADLFLESKHREKTFIGIAGVNPFEGILLRSSAGLLLLDALRKLPMPSEWIWLDAPYERHRQQILFEFDGLKKIPELEGSHFVFAHVLAPHPPFVFGKNGEAVMHREPYSIQDGDRYPGTREEYISGYREQLQYVNELLLDALEAIIAKSSAPPIIILQGDHGPGAYLEWESPETSNMHERISILNAYYLPGLPSSPVYPSITPVNTFRVILNEYFGAQYVMLKDKCYFSTWSHPFQFIPVPERDY